MIGIKKVYKLKITCCWILSTVSFLANAQAPSIEWQKSLGGTKADVAYCVQQTTDNGYIVVGYSSSHSDDVTDNYDNGDCWVVKLNSTGGIQWKKSLGGNDGDGGYYVQQTTDGGYIVAGNSASTDGDVTGNHGGMDYWLVKLSSAGSVQWQKSLGGSMFDLVGSVKQTNDGGFIIAGSSSSTDGDVTGNHGGYDYWVVKLNNTGTIQWQKSLGGTQNDIASYVQQTSDGGFFIIGNSYSTDDDVTGNHGYSDCWIVKLDNAGTIQWQKCVGGSNYDFALSGQQTTDGGYIFAGYSNSTDGDLTGNYGSYDFLVVKLDNVGTIQWQKSLGGTKSENANSIQQTTDGGYIVAGLTQSNDTDVSGNQGFNNYWVSKLDNTGNIVWQRCLGGSNEDEAKFIQQTNDGGYIVAGGSNSSNGDVTGNHGGEDYWVVKLSAVSTLVSTIDDSNRLEISPNPSSGKFKLGGLEKDTQVEIYDAKGKIILKKSSKNTDYTIDLNDKENSIYFINIKTGAKLQSQKLVIQK